MNNNYFSSNFTSDELGNCSTSLNPKISIN